MGWGRWGWGPLARNDPAPGQYTASSPQMGARVGNGMSAQLVTALSNAGNIAIIDYDYYLQHQNNPANLIGPGEVGPFVIKGMITEFNEVAEANDSRKGGSLGWTGVALGIGGALGGSREAAIAGGALATANPTYESKEAKRTGSVAMDLQLVDPQNGRIIGSILASGKFVSVSATSGFSMFGVGGGESAFAASSLGQASRAALNDATRKITTRLSTSGYSSHR